MSFSGPWFNIKMTSYQYRKSHCGDKTILWPSYLHNGISYTGKMSSLYWIGALEHHSIKCVNILIFLSGKLSWNCRLWYKQYLGVWTDKWFKNYDICTYSYDTLTNDIFIVFISRYNQESSRLEKLVTLQHLLVLSVSVSGPTSFTSGHKSNFLHSGRYWTD